MPPAVKQAAIREMSRARDSPNGARSSRSSRPPSKGWQQVDEEERERNFRRRLGVGVCFGKQPPERRERERREGVRKRPREQHLGFRLGRDTRKIARDDRPVRHEQNFVEAVAFAPRGDGVREFVFERRQHRRKEQQKLPREGGEYPRRQKERMHAHAEGADALPPARAPAPVRLRREGRGGGRAERRGRRPPRRSRSLTQRGGISSKQARLRSRCSR